MSDDLDKLQEKLAQFRGEKKAGAPESSYKGISDEENTQNMSNGMRAGMELVSSIVAGAFIGWALDKGFDTQPLFLIIFLLGGIGTGFMNVYKITQNIGGSVGFAPLHKREKKGTNTADQKVAPDNTGDGKKD